MRMSLKYFLSRLAVAMVAVILASGSAFGASRHFLITNDDSPPFTPTGVSFYSIAADGLLTLQGQVPTEGYGIGGGFFGSQRVRVLDSGSTQCVYASEATNADIVGIVVSTQTVGGRATGSSTDGGTSNGIGLALNSKYLYASFSDSNTIGTFQLLPGCSLSFVGDTAVGGLQGGTVDAMAIHGNMLIATYGDGSVESFNISAGSPISNGDKQNSTAAVKMQGATYPSGIDITQDGHFAIFGDTSTAMVVEVSDISSGKLTATKYFQSVAGINSSNVMLSPDETLLYMSNTQGDRVSATFFDKNTGNLTGGCISNHLKGFVSDFTYLGSLATATTTGTGGGVYVAEFGGTSAVGMIKVESAGGQCSLSEAAASPVSDPNSPGLLSITTFPPRSF